MKFLSVSVYKHGILPVMHDLKPPPPPLCWSVLQLLGGGGGGVGVYFRAPPAHQSLIRVGNGAWGWLQIIA